LTGLITERIRGRAVGLVVVCLAILVALDALVSTRVLLHPGRGVIGANPASDFGIMSWSLAWWPWAASHGVNPLRANVLWPPVGFPLLWMTSIPVPALLAAPLTLTAGPLAAYNALMVVSVLAAAAAAFLLCYELTESTAAAIAGGLVFALSPYMLGHTMSQHLNLVFVFPLPLLILLLVRLLRGKTSPRRFVLGSGTLLLVLAGTSLELFVDLAFVAALVSMLAFIFAPSHRRSVARAAGLAAAAYALCLPVIAPAAVVAFSAVHVPIQNAPANYEIDMANVLIPTPTNFLGGLPTVSRLSAHFAGNIGERDGYVGLPLLLIAIGGLVAARRRGAWAFGLLALVAFALSLGATLELEGRTLLTLPVWVENAPVLDDTLPARMTLFLSIALACLAAIWFARPGRRSLKLAAGVLLALSLAPNFWLARTYRGAWAVTESVAWSLRAAPTGFTGARRWTRTVRPGSNVLVLPTRDRTPAMYWLAASGMRFSLAMPETPFVPPSLAAAPTVARLVDNVLPELEQPRIAAGRFRAYVLAEHVGTVVVSPWAGAAWQRVVERALQDAPRRLGGSLVFSVRPGLRPLRVESRATVAGPPAARLRAWIAFNGRRGEVRTRLGRYGRVVTLSSPTGDAVQPAVAVGPGGEAAVVFTEWRNHTLSLRVATRGASTWRLATLERSRQPIWSPRVAVTADRRTVVAWVDVDGPLRHVLAATLTPGASRRDPTTLDSGLGLGTLTLRSAGACAVAAWLDSRASIGRVETSFECRGRWLPPETLAATVAPLSGLAIVGRGAGYVTWKSWGDGRGVTMEAARRGLAWSPAWAVPATCSRAPQRPAPSQPGRGASPECGRSGRARLPDHAPVPTQDRRTTRSTGG
jgi:hypothetical protein